MRAGFLAPLLRQPDVVFSLRNTRTGETLASRVEPALDSQTRRRGLLGRDGLDEGTALVIAPSNAVHTFFMRFPIDVVFVRRDGSVIKVRRNLWAWRVAFALKAFAVIEMGASSGVTLKLRAGDRLELTPGASGG